jgi:predicted RNA-binding Zn-ribbon protein involved in translation (DUF1610 family)
MPKPIKIQKNVKRHRLFLDIETSPNVGLFWSSGFKLNIPPENIIQERTIICIAWKWEGNKKIYCKAWDKNQNDKSLLTEFVKEMHKADEIVTHNGSRFDIPWVRTRCLIHKIPMAPNFVSIDTCQTARNLFYFNSNKMNYVSQLLGTGKKTLTDYELWKSVLLDKDPKALKTMMDYCKNDVIMLEGLHDRLKSYMPAKSNFAKFIHLCPECGGDTIINKRRVTAAGYKQIQYQCKVCGKYATVAASRYEKRGKI